MPIVKRIHTWLGLATFVNLMVYGIAGLAAALNGQPPESGEAKWMVSEREFRIAPNLTDAQVGERICELLGLSLATPVQPAAIHREKDGALWFDFWHVNGEHKVRVLEEAGRIRVEHRQASFAGYLDALHATTAAFRGNDWRMNLWAGYNEFAMWSLVGMMLSGVWLWMAERGRHRLAWLMFGAGCAVFAGLWMATR